MLAACLRAARHTKNQVRSNSKVLPVPKIHTSRAVKLKLQTVAVYRHRTVSSVNYLLPSIAPDAFVAPSAAVSGEVVVGSGASVWYGAVVRGATQSNALACRCWLLPKFMCMLQHPNERRTPYCL